MTSSWLLCALLGAGLLPSRAWAGGAAFQLDAMSGGSAGVQAGVFDGSLSAASEAAVFVQASGAGLSADLERWKEPRAERGRRAPLPAPAGRADGPLAPYLGLCAGGVLGMFLVLKVAAFTAAAASVVVTAMLLGWLLGATIHVARKAYLRRRAERKKAGSTD